MYIYEYNESYQQINNNINSIQGVKFSGIFINNTIIQREPYLSAIYELSDTSNINIMLTIKGENNNGDT